MWAFIFCKHALKLFQLNTRWMWLILAADQKKDPVCLAWDYAWQTNNLLMKTWLTIVFFNVSWEPLQIAFKKKNFFSFPLCLCNSLGGTHNKSVYSTAVPPLHLSAPPSSHLRWLSSDWPLLSLAFPLKHCPHFPRFSRKKQLFIIMEL